MSQNDELNDFQKAVVGSIVGTAIIPGVGTVLGGGFYLIRGCFRWWKAGEPARQAKKARKLEDARKEAEHHARLQLIEQQRVAALNAPKPALPPTRDQIAASARQRYEATLRMLDAAGLDEIELAAAKDRAKQVYLREIDAVMS